MNVGDVVTIERNEGLDHLSWRRGPGKVVEIVDIAVTSDRRAGIGRSLLEQLYATIPADTHLVYAIARASNQIAAEFYAAVGFERMAVLFSFYPEGHAVVYGRKL